MGVVVCASIFFVRFRVHNNTFGFHLLEGGKMQKKYKYTKKEFENIVLEGVLWEEIVGKKLNSVYKASFHQHSFHSVFEYNSPVCTSFLQKNNECKPRCPLYDEEKQLSCTKTFFVHWGLDIKTHQKAAKKYLEALYSGYEKKCQR